MDRSTLRLAAKLLAKAEDTEFEAEAAALAEKAYTLLAEFLNGLEEPEGTEPSTGSGRRRERRLRRDRRTARRMFGRRGAVAGSSADGSTNGSADARADASAEATYRREGRRADRPPGDIDLRA